jgi:RNA polymerase sigma factor (sigma-70 family)
MALQTEEFIPTRASLIERLKDWQDRASWQEFFDTYWKLIYGVARKTGASDSEAQDVVQETMASVAKQMPTFRYDPALGSFKGWLLKLTRWRIIDQIRKRPPPGSICSCADPAAAGTGIVEKLIDPESEALDELWNAEWETNLLEAAKTIVKRKSDPAKYQIFDFYVNKGWSAEKVAERFRLPVEQVYMAKHRITEMLKAEVRRLERDAT